MLRQDDLLVNGWKIWQDTESFRFGTDAVLLAWFAARKRFRTAADLCCGNGIVPLLLAEYDCAEILAGADRDAAAVSLAQRSVTDNGLDGRIRIVCEDIRRTSLPLAKWDLVTVNPPYFRVGTGKPAAASVEACRAEREICFAQIAQTAAKLLRCGGRFCFIHKPERMPELFRLCADQRLEPKELLLVCPRADRAPEWMLTECRKGGKPGLNVLPPLILYTSAGEETPAFSALHHH